ncbi:NAD(P)/FAD-dependent oxidoreductase [Palleronia caenipelagi]|uniref:FAD-dependent oxidoreductase n=1 Tax=Palleronia caenipelagi TaxID=2489174 RepID=A0A547Q7H4_9RHOB|nr:FAD-dependent oxidoreductase [Palleronia caenipelagi]TRD22313.1 FAD-dependent oxidoreductase [Palleronia caenipelagi]
MGLPPRVAVIGGGISGLAAAWRLRETHRVVLYESENRLGGHARTVMAGKRGDQPVDTGFIVFNRMNYPHLSALFDELYVPVANSDMSFGASFDGGRFEYGLRNLSAVFAQPRNAVDPRYWRMIRDILRFNARALDVADRPDMSLGELLDRVGTGAWFRDRYLLPLSGAIWSTPAKGILDFPAQALIRFFDNHALLHHTGQHQWLTVRGGSKEYLSRMSYGLRAAGVKLRLGTPVARVTRPGGQIVVTADGQDEVYDDVIFATHSDVALTLLGDPTDNEHNALSKLRYKSNKAILHADASVMPVRKKVWSSWNYRAPTGEMPDHIELTYWMNSLQPIPDDDPLFVTLNPVQNIDPALVMDEVWFRHPYYDSAAEEGRAEIRRMNGAQGTWFCGAWMRNGFHEDGFASAVTVTEAIAARFGTENTVAAE